MKNNPNLKLRSNTSLSTSRGLGHQVEMTRSALSSLIDLAARTGRGVPDSIELAHFGDFGIIRDGDQELIRVRNDVLGNIRSLTAQPGISLYRAPYEGQSLAYVNHYLEEDTVRKSLKLANVNLVAEEVSDMGINGERVGYKQTVRTKCNEDGCLKDIEIPVYKGFVYASVTAEGELINLTSTIAHARKPERLGKVISKEEAVGFAQKRFGKRTEVASNELFMIDNNGDFEPVYVVTLKKLKPTKASGPSVKEILVDAKSGRIVHWYERLRFNQHSSTQDRVLNSPVGSVLHRIPDPSDDIAKQAGTEFFENLPDPSTMANQFFNVFTLQGSGSGDKSTGTAKNFIQAAKKTKKKGRSSKAAKQWKLLKANADGSFVFKVGTDGFCAAIDFFALTKEMETCARLGLKKVTIVVPVHISDPDNEDNAWLDPTGPLMSIGQGTGVNRGGLIKYIAYDIGVCWHECGHWIVTIQTPGHDLTGAEGAAMHEAIGDIMTVIMNCLFRLMYAKKLGMNFTKKDLQADPFDIGGYAAQPGVIRHGRNHKQTPQDKTGEPHDDSEIVTGALVDFFTDFVLAWPGDDLVEAIEAFLRVILYALANMPASQQQFTDLLQALITAVQNTTNGKIDTKIIEAAFKKHSIVLGATAPVVVKRRRRKSKTPVTVAA
jgi:Zn-dependent metalloprotease